MGSAIWVDTVLNSRGYSKFQLGAMSYFHLPLSGTPALVGQVKKKPQNLPIVFIHGVACGLMTYMPLLNRLPELGEVFVVTLPAILTQTMDGSSIATSTEFANSVCNMLLEWGHTKAHFIGHSFGTLACTWVMNHDKSLVSILSVLDPICFFPEKCLREISRDFCIDKSKQGAMDRLVGYFGIEELQVAATVQRKLDFDMELWPEDLRQTPTFLCLDSSDTICPSYIVRLLFEVEVSKRSPGAAPVHIMWVGARPHGSFLINSRVRRDLISALKKIHQEGLLWHTMAPQGKRTRCASHEEATHKTSELEFGPQTEKSPKKLEFGPQKSHSSSPVRRKC